MNTKEDGAKIKQMIVTLMKAGISIKDMQDLLKNLEWLAGEGQKLSQPDISIKREMKLDKPSKKVSTKKGKKRGS
jgi:hypothetical protein